MTSAVLKNASQHRTVFALFQKSSNDIPGTAAAAQESATPGTAESPIAEPQETAAMAVSLAATLLNPQPGYGFILPSAQQHHVSYPEKVEGHLGQGQRSMKESYKAFRRFSTAAGSFSPGKLS